VGRASQPWRFMHLQSETVTETVAKEVSISALLNVVARDGVGIPSRHAGANAGRRVFVRRANHIVDLALFRLRDADDARARDVGAVALCFGAEVQQEKIAGLDSARRRPRVWQRRARTRGDDRGERESFTALVAQR